MSRPERRIGESGEAWIARMHAFWETDEGKAIWAAESRAYEERKAADARAFLARGEQEKRRQLAAIGIPERALEFVKGPLKETEATESLKDVPTLLVLSGNPGCGKTIAACAWLYASGSGLFLKSSRLARWDRYDDEQMTRLLSAPRLVVDDLGTEYQDAKGNFDSVLDELIDARYDKKLPTVLTTNLDAAAFKARYGERIADRIREAGRFVSLAAKSMRGAA